MTSPDVSVVITNYNYAQFLSDAIDSVLDQGPGVEIIVVDDGSTDESLDVLRNYQDRITILAKVNGGQGSAFNLGVDAAAGQLIMLLDADDMLLPGAVARVRATATEAPDAVMFLQPLQIVDGAGRPTGAMLPEAGRALPSGDLRKHMLSHPDDISWQPTSGLTFRSNVLRQVLPMPDEPFRVCADVFLVNTVPLHGLVAAIDQAGAQYRDHGANAHLRSSFDLDRTRATIERSDLTHQEIRRLAIALNLQPENEPLSLRSVTDHASRLLVARLDGTGAQSVLRQSRCGAQAALRRPDIGFGRKVVMIGWFAVAVVAPRPMLSRLASLALTR